MNELSMTRIYSRFLSRVYGWMSLGLALTAATAFFVASSPAIISMIFSSPIFFWGLVIGQFALVTYVSAAINKMSVSTAKTCFILYSILTGTLLSTIFLVYTWASIGSVFLISSSMFAAMAIYGSITKADLSGMRSTLTLGLFGLVFASIINMFMKSSSFDFALSVFGVIIFTLLTAYDAQKLKELAYSYDAYENMQKLSILGALTLYLDFINLFLYLLRLMGKRRND